MKSRFFYTVSTLAIVILALTLIYALPNRQSRDKDYRDLFGRSTRILTPELPAKASFCGEEVPLGLFYVREAYERELLAASFMHTSTILMFKRAYRYFPIIEPILKKNKIPDEFKFLAVAESNLSNVTSPAGAEGFWQFMKTTGQQYGLEINNDVDERYHLEKATEAACRYLMDAYSQFGSWTLVAASYNRGKDGISKALQKQKVNNYYDLYLNDETSRYLFRILAFKQVYLNPVKYGFLLREQDMYPPIPTRIITIDTAIPSLPEFALKHKINFRILRELNPWIQSYTLPNKSRKIYSFLLPKEGALQYDALLKKIPVRENFYRDTLRINEVN